MIVTKEDINTGRMLILPAGWQECYGNVRAALSGLRESWRKSIAAARPGETLSGWGLICGADTQRGIVRELVARKADRHDVMILDLQPKAIHQVTTAREMSGFIVGEAQTHEVPLDFDVVTPLGRVLAEARRCPRYARFQEPTLAQVIEQARHALLRKMQQALALAEHPDWPFDKNVDRIEYLRRAAELLNAIDPLYRAAGSYAVTTLQAEALDTTAKPSQAAS